MNPYYTFPPTNANQSATPNVSDSNNPPTQLPYLPYSQNNSQDEQVPPPPPSHIPIHHPIHHQYNQEQQQPIDPTNQQPINPNINSTNTSQKEFKQENAPQTSSNAPQTTTTAASSAGGGGGGSGLSRDTSQQPRVEHHYHVVFPQDNPQINSTQPTWEENEESTGAKSSLSLSICLSILLACVGCFPLSCIPYWFVYATYSNSTNRQAQSVSAVARTLFLFTVAMNVCLCFISVFVVVIVPPAVVVPRY